MGLAAIAVVYYVSSAGKDWLPQPTQPDRPLIVEVKRMKLPILVTAGGELASAEAAEVVCDLEGQAHKIIQMLPEGTQVKQGDVVIRLDPSEINDRLAEQKIKVTQSEALAKAAAEESKIQQNMSQSKISQAQLALELSRLDEEKYVEGDYKVEFNTLQGSVALAKVELQDANSTLGHYRDLVKKGFRSPEELRTKAQAVERAEYNLARDEEKLKVLEDFVRKRQMVELKAKALEANRELERAKSSAAATDAKSKTEVDVAVATADLERQQLARIAKQLELCEIRSTANGPIVYAKDKNKAIEIGGTVHFKQKLFSIPSSTQMKVDAFVHESVIKKVHPGLTALVRIDAFQHLELRGRVLDVAPYYDATRHWTSGGVKDYATTIVLDESPSVPLRTGMTAEVTIFVDERPSTLVVPLAAVSQRDGSHYCFVKSGETFEARPVKIGANTDDLVEIIEGVQEKDIVALDASLRIKSQIIHEPNKAEPKVLDDSKQVASSK